MGALNTRMALRLPEKLMGLVTRDADKAKINKSQQIREIIEQHYDKRPQKK